MLSLLLVGIQAALMTLATTFAGIPFPVEDSWQIIPGERIGSINADTCEEDLVSRFGRDQVRRGEVGLGEGEEEPGTALFPNDPVQRVEILWRDRERRCRPRLAILAGDQSRWRTEDGIGLGTSIEDLEKLNGRPFKLLGFSWDFGGTVVSWERGLLADNLAEPGTTGRARTILRLGPEPEVPFRDMTGVLGDREFSSALPAMKRLEPRVHQMIVEFP